MKLHELTAQLQAIEAVEGGDTQAFASGAQYSSDGLRVTVDERYVIADMTFEDQQRNEDLQKVVLLDSSF